MSEATAVETAAAPIGNTESAHGKKRTLTGVVISDKSTKTIVVNVTRRVRHPVYGKEIKVSKKYHAHDERSEAKAGDTVRIVESRPLSKLKRWRLVEVVTKATAVA